MLQVRNVGLLQNALPLSFQLSPLGFSGGKSDDNQRAIGIVFGTLASYAVMNVANPVTMHLSGHG